MRETKVSKKSRIDEDTKAAFQSYEGLRQLQPSKRPSSSRTFTLAGSEIEVPRAKTLVKRPKKRK